MSKVCRNFLITILSGKEKYRIRLLNSLIIDADHFAYIKEYRKAVNKYLKSIRMIERGKVPTQEKRLGALHVRLARVFEKDSNDSLAISHFEKAVDLNSNQANWFASLATLYKKHGALEKAISSFRAAIHLNPKVPVWHAELSEAEELLISGDKYNPDRDFSIKKSSWYNEFYAKSEQYLEPYSESIYFPVWKVLIEKIASFEPVSILDIGCGPGQMACAVRGLLPGVKYHGVDFSEQAIDIAERVCPDFSFEVNDGIKKVQELTIDDFSVIICTEVLEHIQDDILLIKGVPNGTQFVGSVPNFDAAGHVRVFRTSEEVRERYGHYFRSFNVEEIILKDDCKIYVFAGVKTLLDERE